VGERESHKTLGKRDGGGKIGKKKAEFSKKKGGESNSPQGNDGDEKGHGQKAIIANRKAGEVFHVSKRTRRGRQKVTHFSQKKKNDRALPRGEEGNTTIRFWEESLAKEKGKSACEKELKTFE